MRRVWLDAAEIALIAARELEATGLYPARPGPVAIERFVEKRFGFSYEFAPLDGCLGKTVFGPDGPAEILISERLDRPHKPRVDRLCRSTIAHECGHGILHAWLYAEVFAAAAPAWKNGKIAGDPLLNRWFEPPPVRLADGRLPWWEVQANLAAAELLLPRRIFERFCLETCGLKWKINVMDQEALRYCARRVSEVFHVGYTLAKYQVAGLCGVDLRN